MTLPFDDPIYEATRCIPLPATQGRIQQIARAYNKLASCYDETFQTPLALAENRIIFDALRRKIRPGQKILDLGCGTGLLLEYLPEINPYCYNGVDISSGMLERAEKKFPQHMFSMRDMANLRGFRSNVQDWCISLFNSMSYCQYPYSAFSEMYRVLRPEGRIFLMLGSRRYATRPSYILNQHGIESQMEYLSARRLYGRARASGFMNIRIRGFHALAENYFEDQSERFLNAYLKWEGRILGRIWPDSCYFLLLEARKPS